MKSRNPLGLGFLVLGLSMAFAGDSGPLDDFSSDGWYAWEVDVIEDAPNWCCFSWHDGVVKKKPCNLDNRHSNYGSSRDYTPAPGEMRIYAKIKSGEAVKLRTVSPECPVKTKTQVTELGFVETDQSVNWLKQYVTPHNNLSSDALAAIAVHKGSQSRMLLVNMARNDSSFENRKEAVFWMGQIRSADTGDAIKSLMFTDENPKFREHAAFSLSQSKVPKRADALVRLGKQDKNADVRGKAWFWLAQTEASQSESEIKSAIKNEKDRRARHEAIFALSQLPEERAYKALISVVEDRRLTHDDRKQALFWLVDSGSDEAMKYLDHILSAN